MSTRLPLPGVSHPTCWLFPNVGPPFFTMKPLPIDNQPCGAALPHQPDLFLTALATNITSLACLRMGVAGDEQIPHRKNKNRKWKHNSEFLMWNFDSGLPRRRTTWSLHLKANTPRSHAMLHCKKVKNIQVPMPNACLFRPEFHERISNEYNELDWTSI